MGKTFELGNEYQYFDDFWYCITYRLYQVTIASFIQANKYQLTITQDLVPHIMQRKSFYY